MSGATRAAMRTTAARVLGLAALFVFASADAWAACTITVSPIVFGRYDVFDPQPLEATGRLLYECASPVDRLRVRISRGESSARSHALRNGADRLVYQLFLDPQLSRVWGDETEGTEALYVDAPPSGTSVSVPIFARINARQNVRAGVYSDSVTIVVDF